MNENPRDRLRLRRWCVRRLLQDQKVDWISITARVPRRTVYYWWTRFQRKGWEGLVDASKRPHTIHHLPEETVARVLRVRRIHGWCAEAIEAHLRSQGVQVSHRSIYLILKRNNLITKSYKPRKQRSYIRFARQHPDSLWQTDIKYYGNRYLVAYLDDCSRYIPAASLHREATTDNVLATLEEALSNDRNPSQILSDHGPQYWSNDGDSRFTNFCNKHGIEHIYGFHWKTNYTRQDRKIIPNLRALLPKIQKHKQIHTILQQQTPQKPEILYTITNLLQHKLCNMSVAPAHLTMKSHPTT